jgi:hypothetical protein
MCVIEARRKNYAVIIMKLWRIIVIYVIQGPKLRRTGVPNPLQIGSVRKVSEGYVPVVRGPIRELYKSEIRFWISALVQKIWLPQIGKS